MKIIKRIALAIAAASLLAAVAGCELYQGINLAWNITSVGPGAPGCTRVSYAAQNMGKYDLKGVNLQIGVDLLGNDTYPVSSWTQDFNINQNQILYGSIDIPTPSTGIWATVLSVDMDSPSGT
jgi:hypothetical protein